MPKVHLSVAAPATRSSWHAHFVVSSRPPLFATSLLLLSNIFSNVLMVLGVYFVGRLVTPAELGVASAVLALVLTAYPLFTLRYDLAIPVAPSDQEARDILLLCVGLGALCCLVVSFALVVGTAVLGDSFVPSDTRGLLLLAAPAAFALSLCTALQYFALRSASIATVGLSRVGRAIALLAGQVGLVLLFSNHSLWLVVADILASLLAAAIVIGGIRNRLTVPRDLEMRGSFLFRMANLAKRHYRFAIVSLPHAVIHQALQAAYGVLIGVYYGPAAMGFYFVVRRVVFGAIALLGAAVYQSCLSEVAKFQEDNSRARALWIYAVSAVALASVPAGCVLAFWGEPIFSALLGDNWSDAGRVGAGMVLLIAVEPIAAAVAFLPVVLHRQVEAMLWMIVQNVVGLVALVASFHLGLVFLDAILWSSGLVALILTLYVMWLGQITRRGA